MSRSTDKCTEKCAWPRHDPHPLSRRLNLFGGPHAAPRIMRLAVRVSQRCCQGPHRREHASFVHECMF